ncbi:hypothetical protein OCU04_010460 [Sclerotinia nivalis]|uniref:Uncharacterized protein n=1 Tax=Sclerotinia nivalis TaxID=352851 RepID=A0A9X0AFH0_9HELO|nr:hypothetical protein OCU04_010460 [Sclerotinia nivalis]
MSSPHENNRAGEGPSLDAAGQNTRIVSPAKMDERTQTLPQALIPFNYLKLLV